jgi:gamma-glutamylcyclotransferase (GGCT)/AIG2-like uncharacterized protein YtfP
VPHVEYFPGHDDGSYNDEFYAYFIDRIRHARQNILIAGEGFEFADSEGEQLAANFVRALAHALSRGVQVVRVQTRSNPHPRWVQMLAELIDTYPGRLDLYVLLEDKVARMSSVCVLDPDDAIRCVVEVMLSTQRSFGVRAADVAGTAVFIEGKQNLAQDLQKRIRSLTQPDVSCRARTGQEVYALLESSEYYFAYGSNMSQEQMQQRVPGADLHGVAVLADHELVFNRRGSYRDGGVAGLRAATGSRVFGIVWRVPGSALRTLDELEDPAAYDRREVVVNLLNGQALTCHAYFARPQGLFKPDPDYLEVLIGAAKEVGLPRQYVRFLEGLRSAGSTSAEPPARS